MLMYIINQKKGVYKKMAIPISKIVEINPRVIKAGSQELEIAGLYLSENELTPFPTLKAYASKDAVGEYYGLDSIEYLAASHYFQSYDNSFKKPNILYFANGYLRQSQESCSVQKRYH